MIIQKKPEMTLQDLYNTHHGKVSDKWHSCLVFYNELFGTFRHKKVRVLEIGVQNGGSLELWAKYFPNAEKIVGCDINTSCSRLQFEDDRISVVVGDASTAHTATEIFGIAKDFDIIIDDGSHESGDVIRTFSQYFGNLTPGGVYVVEDLHCSYWQEDFNGGLNAPFSSVSFFKRIIDMVNYEHWGTETSPSVSLDYFLKTYDIAFDDNELRSIESVVFRNSLCVVRKAECETVQLGKRVIAGKDADVTSDPIFVDGSMSVAPSQSSNAWGPRFGSPEHIVASVYEKRTHEEHQQELLERERQDNKLLKKKLQKVVETIELQQRTVINGVYDLAGLLQTGNRFFRHPILSRLTSKASRWAAGLPGLSGCRREKFLRSAKKRDVSALLDSLMRALNDFLDNFKPSDGQYQIGLKHDRDGIVLPMPTEVKEVDIVVCCHNALESVRACLSSIVANTSPPYRLILVDDGSKDDTKHYLEAFAGSQGAVLIRNETAGGYTRAANCGLRASTSSWAILLNSDTIVPFGWIGEMLKVGESDPNIGIIGPASNTASWQSAPLLFDEDGDWAANPLPEGLSVQNMQEIASSNAPPQGIDLPFINGFAYMIRRELIEDIGTFDEETFGAGYGEENDYCVRARRAGWKLVFTPNSYVYHAQSKSYGIQERLKLAADANDNLLSKYDGNRDVAPQVAFCKDNLAALSFRARFAIALEDIDCSAHPYAGKRIAVLCPVGRASGGGNILVEESKCFERLGAQVWLINLQANHHAFEETYKCNLESLYFDNDDEIRTFLQKNILQFDAIVASAFFTVNWLPDQFDDKSARLGYYIQDNEPGFFEEGTLGFHEALQSYAILGRAKGFTKTNWNAEAIEQRGFPRPTVVGASVDLARFRPKGRDVGATESVRFAAMLRFDEGKDRRAPRRTMRVLNKLVKFYGHRIELFVFGSVLDHPKKSMLSKEVIDLGILHPSEVATLFRSVDIFLDFSDWQAMGLSAMEAMASGCAVVVPCNGGVGDYCVDEHSGLIVNSFDEDACYDAACKLVDDPALLRRLRRTATREICMFTQERSARRILDVLFGDSK